MFLGHSPPACLTRCHQQAVVPSRQQAQHQGPHFTDVHPAVRCRREILTSEAQSGPRRVQCTVASEVVEAVTLEGVEYATGEVSDSLGGEAELERLVAEGGKDLSAERVCQIFPHPLDGFQQQALQVFLDGKSVVVCAPTGAGKTAIAEAAAAATLARGKRVIYTTPLKALSNQKLFEMRKRFGSARCGLQTGDTSLNTEAQVVVMTTEILRNIMYRIAEANPLGSDPMAPLTPDGSAGLHDALHGAHGNGVFNGSSWSPSMSSMGGDAWAGGGAHATSSYASSSGQWEMAGSHGSWDSSGSEYSSSMLNSSSQGNSSSSSSSRDGSSSSSGGDGSVTQSSREERLGDVGLVVMDEVHYLGDPHRGSVWEEAIINCPRHIQLVCMSATVKNPDELGAWICKEHMDCETIKTRFRPVPLHWRHAYMAAPPRGVQLIDLLINKNKNLNPRLTKSAVLQEEARNLMERQSRNGRPPATDVASVIKTIEGDPEALKKLRTKRVPNMDSLIMRLRSKELLPAIWFIMSRKDCDLSAMRATGGTLCLTTAEEQQVVKAELAALEAESPEAVKAVLVGALVRGVASHHAGQLPGWKALVERLFQKGVLKVVFATGTLAAGINMPARTTVISALSRMTDDGPKLLPHNELLQMAGRAGRRGYDTEGHCIVLQTRFEGPEEAWEIIKGGPEPLLSQFNVSYGLVLNLLSIYTLEQARDFCQKSFGAFQKVEGNQRKVQEIQQLEASAQLIMTKYNASATSNSRELNEAVESSRARLRALRMQAIAARMQQAHSKLQAEGLPRKVLLDLSSRTDIEKPSQHKHLLPAVVVGEVEQLQPGGDAPAPQTAEAGQSGKSLPPGSFYLALGADNRLLRISVLHVVAVDEGASGSLSPEDVVKVQAAASSVRRGGWTWLSAAHSSGLAAVGGSGTALVALQLQTQAQALAVEPGLLAAILKAKAEHKSSMSSLESQRKSFAVNNGLSTSTHADRVAMAQLAQAQRLQSQAAKLKAEISVVGEDTWRKFTEVVDILTAMNAVEAGTLSILPLGLAARSLQGQNELWLALVLTHPVIMQLSGPQLAGLLGAILSAEVLRKSTAIFTAYSASDEVQQQGAGLASDEGQWQWCRRQGLLPTVWCCVGVGVQLVMAVDALEEQRQLLSQLQADAGLGYWNDALLLDLRLAGIVEAWAAGATWQQIMADCGMDDGDIARLLIRTVDLLKQITHQNALLPHLREAAREAMKGMDRKPIAETLI